MLVLMYLLKSNSDFFIIVWIYDSKLFTLQSPLSSWNNFEMEKENKNKRGEV